MILLLPASTDFEALTYANQDANLLPRRLVLEGLDATLLIVEMSLAELALTISTRKFKANITGDGIKWLIFRNTRKTVGGSWVIPGQRLPLA